MPVYERVSAVVGLTLIGLALYFVLDFPNQVVRFNLFGSPLSINAPRQWLMAILLAGLVMAGTDAVVRAHPNLSSQRLNYLATFWTLPGLLVILATETLGLAPNPIAWAGGLMTIGILLWLTILAEYRQVSAGLSVNRWSGLWQQIVGFGIALVLFLAIYFPRNRSALSATGILVVSAMVALALLRQRPEANAKTWLYANVIGLSLGEITWALNYWQVSTLDAGLFLVLVFYVLVGLARQQLFEKISTRILLEFGTVTLIGLLVIIYL